MYYDALFFCYTHVNFCIGYFFCIFALEYISLVTCVSIIIVLDILRWRLSAKAYSSHASNYPFQIMFCITVSSFVCVKCLVLLNTYLYFGKEFTSYIMFCFISFCRTANMSNNVKPFDSYYSISRSICYSNKSFLFNV